MLIYDFFPKFQVCNTHISMKFDESEILLSKSVKTVNNIEE